MEPWRRLNEASADEARALLRSCCGASRWIERMLARRPFRDRGQLLAIAREEWFALDRHDWLDGFADHPKIGDRDGLRTRYVATRHLSAAEQAGVDSASDTLLGALADANRAYELRFGYNFIVCASGKTAQEMLTLLENRLHNDPETEIRVAAEEHAKITELRLMKIG